MNVNPVKIADALTIEYSEFLDYCASAGKTYIEELSHVDYIAFRTSRSLSRDYIAKIRSLIDNCVLEVSTVSADEMAPFVKIADGSSISSQKEDALIIQAEDDPNAESKKKIITSQIQETEEETNGETIGFLANNLNQNGDDTESIFSNDPTTDEEMDSISASKNTGKFISLDEICCRHLEDTMLAEVFNIDSANTSDYSIRLLDLSVRSMKCLRNSSCSTVSDVLALSTNQLKSIKNMGVKSVAEIVDNLQLFMATETQWHSSSIISVRSAPVASYAIKNVIAELIDNGCANTSTLTEDELSVYDLYNDAFDVLGPVLCKSAISGNKHIIALIQTLNSFAEPCLKYMKSIEDAERRINKLSNATKNKKAHPFMEIYKVRSNKALNILPDICNEDTSIYQIPELLRKYKDSDELEALSNDVNRFLAWLDFDIHEITNDLIEKLKEVFAKKGSRALEIFKRRIDGESLEEVGASLSITRERVRQIEAKVYRAFWDIYGRQKYDLVMLVYAIRNGDSVIYYDELKETIGNFAAILWACLKKVSGLKYYEYSKDLEALVITLGGDTGELHNIKEKISLAMQEMPGIFEEKEYRHLIEIYSIKHIMPEEILRKSIEESYKKTGLFYHRNRLTVLYMCEYVLKERFPAGYKIADEFESGRFKQYLTELFGEHAGHITARAIDAKVMELGCLCDRGKYIHKDALNVDTNVINAINDYVEASSRNALSYTEVYDKLADTFMGTQITNRYLLQGALKKYGCKYRTNRDYILKEDGISVADELDAFIEQYGIIYKGDIFAEFRSLDDIRLGQIVARCPNVYNIDNGYYIHASLFDIRPRDYSGIREYLQSACEEIPVNIRAIYEDVSVQFPQFMGRNDFDDRNKLFAALNHMFGSEFKFSRPYIAKLGTGDISNRSVILQHLQEYDSIEIDELIGICEINNIHYVCLSYLSQLISPDFIRIDRDTFMRSEIAGVDDQIIAKVSEIIAEQLEYRDYIVASRFDDFIWMPDISVDWNPFLLESVCLLNKKINTVFLIGNPLAHPNTVFVSNLYKGDTFVTMVLKILKEKVLQGYFNSKVEMREWLLEEELIEGKLPNILGKTQYFFVTEKGVQYTGKEVE